MILPASLPSFVAGLKQGWAFAWRSLMAGELLVIIADQPSLGRAAVHRPGLSRHARALLSIMIVILVIGIVVDMLFEPADDSLRRRWGLTGSS